MNHLASALTSEERIDILRGMRELTAIYLASSHRKRIQRLEHAFRFAADACRDRRRRDGRPHITHPIAVARIVAEELGLGSTSICAALLHDVLDNSEYTIEEVRDAFGHKIGSIIEGLSRISGGILAAREAVDAEKFRNLLMSMDTDVRVVLVKMADRMHNLRDIASLPDAKRDKIARETLYVYAPLAHRLGLNAFKEEFENLAFRHLYPEEYAEIERRVEQDKENRDRMVAEFLAPVRSRLDEAGFEYEVKSRVKSVWSIFNKMRNKGVSFDEVYDIYAARIIFTPPDGMDDAGGCFAIRDIIRSLYETSPDRDRDWVTVPKSNGYSALHLTALARSGQWVEVQIRSRVQDEIAELGYAAHWKYKEGGTHPGAEALEAGIAYIKEVLDNPTPTGMDSLDYLRLSLLSPEIYVFTPMGDVVRLPRGATVLDMAYAVHSRLGDHCIGAKVGQGLRHPSDRLRSGDSVEVLTAENRHPVEEWLDWCVSPKTKNRIRRSLNLGR